MFDINELIARVAEYDALIIDADDLIEQDMNRGIIKIDKSVFDDFIENTVIYIYCPDMDANSVMEFVMKTEDDDSITMEWLDSFSL
jgi:hypothetical protein